MDKFHIVLSPPAVKDLDGLSDTQCSKIITAVNVLKNNPFPRGKPVKKIKGINSDCYRLRVDKHRVFYMLENIEIVILRVLSKKDTEKFIRNLNR